MQYQAGAERVERRVQELLAFSFSSAVAAAHKHPLHKAPSSVC